MAKKSSLAERLREKKAEMKSRSSGGDVITLKEGTTRVRHLPVGAEKEFAFEVVYFFLNKELGGFISPATFGEKCAFQRMHDKMKESKDAKDREFAKNRLRPGRKVVSPVVKYKDEDGNEIDEQAGPKLILITPGLYDGLIDMYLDSKEMGDMTDERNGYDIKYSREGKGKQDTKYSLRACKPTQLKKKYRGQTWDIEEMIRAIMPSYEKTKELLEKFMNSNPDEETQDEDRKDQKKKKKKRDL